MSELLIKAKAVLRQICANVRAEPLKGYLKYGRTVVPVFYVLPVAHNKNKRGQRKHDGCYLVFTCPKCKNQNTHTGILGKPGAGDGHRCAPCNCWPNGYFIEQYRFPIYEG